MSAPRFYVGLAATLHDPALAIVGPAGEVLFAEAAERPLQSKRAFNSPPDALDRCAALIREHCPPDADLVPAVSWSRGLLDRLRLAMLCDLPLVRPLLGSLVDRGFRRRDPLLWPLPDFRCLARSMLSSLEQVGVNLTWVGVVPRGREPRRYDHHLAHAATACYTSPFDEAVCAVVDGFGEWTSTAFFHFRDGRLRRLGPQGPWRSVRSGSLGMFYATLCALCGFDPLRGEEWKVMGLAPYGQVDRDLYRRLRSLLRVRGLELLAGHSPEEHRRRIEELSRLGRGAESSPLAAADLACTGQTVFAEVMRELLGNLHGLGLSDNLVLAGGCALNSAWNGRICQETPFRRLFVPCAPADDGTSLGAAFLAFCDDHPGAVPPRGPQSPFLGSAPCRATLERLVRSGGLPRVRHLPGEVTRYTAELLADGRIVGWMQGRAELGPRALGHRSILADPRRADMKDRINAAVKLREGFRPFAPAIPHELGPQYFESYQDSPYMDRALVFRPEVRARIPAVVHVDGTGRLQSVRREWCERFHQLLMDFHERTGVPVLLNTSFNVMGKPMVHSVEDAVAAFLTTGLDALVIEDHLFEKGDAS